MAITGVVTGAVILGAGLYVVASVGDDLYNSRQDQALQDSARATLAAQRQIDATDAVDRGSLSTLAASVRRTVRDTSASQMVYLRRQSGQPIVPDAPPASITDPRLPEAVTEELAASVESGEELQYWQSVRFRSEDGQVVPGIVVASTLSFPASAGTYDLFIGYDLAETQETLGFVQQTLAAVAVAMMLLIGVIVWVISRVVFRPIRVAAAASRRLATGDIEARMPKQNDEHFDVLSANFNDMADTIQSRLRELNELSTMQQRFVSDVSHELRTPLTTIRLASEVMQQGGSEDRNDGQQRAANVLGQQIERFESLLEDLLEISRYDAGRVELEREPTQLAALAQEVADDLAPLSPGPIEVHAIGGHTAVEVDVRRIRRVISNLIGNAIEHGEDDRIEVTIDSNSQAVGIAVRDWGVGMSSAQTERVFDRFWRADPSRTRTLGGTGLGLAITHEDVTVHGGTVEVWSRMGVGTNFLVTLPRSATHTGSLISPIPLVPLDAREEDT